MILIITNIIVYMDNYYASADTMIKLLTENKQLELQLGYKVNYNKSLVSIIDTTYGYDVQYAKELMKNAELKRLLNIQK